MSWSQFEGRVCWWPLPVPTGLCNIARIKVHKDMDEGVWCRKTWVTVTESGHQPDRTPLGGDCKQDLLVQHRCFWKRGQEFPERHSLFESLPRWMKAVIVAMLFQHNRMQSLYYFISLLLSHCSNALHTSSFLDSGGRLAVMMFCFDTSLRFLTFTICWLLFS